MAFAAMLEKLEGAEDGARPPRLRVGRAQFLSRRRFYGFCANHHLHTIGRWNGFWTLTPVDFIWPPASDPGPRSR